LNQVDFPGFRGASGMDKALIEANGIILNLCAIHQLYLLKRLYIDYKGP